MRLRKIRYTGSIKGRELFASTTNTRIKVFVLWKSIINALLHALLECKNVTNLWGSLELCLKDAINQHGKISEIDKISGIDNTDILVNTVNSSSKGSYLL